MYERSKVPPITMALAQHDSFDGPQSETPGPPIPQLGGLAPLPDVPTPEEPTPEEPTPEEPTPDDVGVEPPLPPHATTQTSAKKIRTFVARAPIGRAYP
jgi:hypothetical protein